MLQDGRLKGVKIGNQWRFPQREVERILNDAPIEMESPSNTDSLFPIHCVQTIQNLYTSVSQFSALTLDQNGEMVTSISQPGPVCTLIQSTPSGMEACKTCWRSFAEQAKGREETFTCHAGMKYYGSVIFSQNRKHGVFLVGEFQFTDTVPAERMNLLKKIALLHGISEQKLLEAAQYIPQITKEQQEHLCVQPAAAAFAVESILNERAAYMERLQQIACLTQNI
jgi:ligand-binding sensor protein